MNFQCSILVRGSPADWFDRTQDYDRRLDWDPFLKSAELLDGTTSPDVGVRAWCVAHNGIGMETEYVSFQRPRTCAVKMTRGPWFIRQFAGSWRFEELESEQTRIRFIYSLTANPRWFHWFMTPIVGWYFAREMQQRLVALANTYVDSS
ncbi:SRPBCC family protein [Blastopirellula sp. J2-11]|uniref:type II toxin-antitoxin system RatA family toxin n=1 Tax=Blastopirellula sp. J2-11 TaxID=2943192 RepID=UPI0021C68AD9|nr:SRPBCC family protein [Blastopirellula sp. J2-11]UUO04696.1 SRPBCC family protein [Blastopirellula sp. J2-11]